MCPAISVVNESATLTTTRAWLETVIIKHTLCPFAQREYERGRVRIHEDSALDWELSLLNLLAECGRLDADDGIATTLIVYRDGLEDFGQYLDFLAVAENLLVEQGYEGIYQLASFHPRYLFADSPSDDAAHYTNRSPFPMLHLLRESSITEALKHFPDADSIPTRNMALTRALGLAHCQQLLADCFQH